MISYLRGKLFLKAPDHIIIDTGGVGYEVYVSLNTFYSLPSVGSDVSLHIYTHVREDLIQLYGFHTSEEKSAFLDLISIGGVGPRVAIQILSGVSPSELRRIVAEHDVKRLKRIPGIGKKTAERILLELKHKFKIVHKEDIAIDDEIESEGSVFRDAVSALVNLGYRPNEAKKAIHLAIKKLGDAKLEDVLREALKAMV